MGLITIAAAFGAGYTVGRPDGRAQLRRYLRQAREFANEPAVRRLRERGWDLTVDQLTGAKRRLNARSSGVVPGPASSDPTAQNARHRLRRGWRRRPVVMAEVTVLTDQDRATPHDPSGTDPSVPSAGPAAGFGGSTVAQDSHAVTLGQGTLPPPYLPDPHRPGTPGPTPTGP